MPSLKFAAGLLLGASVIAAPAMAATGKADSTSMAHAASASAQKTYQQDRSACLSGQSSEDKTTCLREAGAALQQSTKLGSEDPAQLEQNRLARCNEQPPQERDQCVQLMKQGTVTGSVDGGGVLREMTTIVPSQPSDQADAGHNQQ